MKNQVVSNFWLFVVGSAIMVTTAILLRNHPHCDLVLYGELLLSGARGIQELVKYYLIGKNEPERLKT